MSAFYIDDHTPVAVFYPHVPGYAEACAALNTDTAPEMIVKIGENGEEIYLYGNLLDLADFGSFIADPE